MPQPQKQTFPPTWIEKLARLSKNNASGQLFVRSQQKFWKFYLAFGWISYATGASAELWHSRLLLYCPQIAGLNINSLIESPTPSESCCWEYQVLFGLVKAKKITDKQASRIIWVSIAEALHDAMSAGSTAESYHLEPNIGSLSIPALKTFNPEKILTEIQSVSQVWQFDDSSFRLAPVFPKLALSSAPDALVQRMDGRHTIWDLAALQTTDFNVDVNVSEVARQVIELHQLGIVKLIQVNQSGAHQAISLSVELDETNDSGDDHSYLTTEFKPVSSQKVSRIRSRFTTLKPYRRRGIIIVGQIVFSILLLAGGACLMWKMQHQRLATLNNDPELKLYYSMQEVHRVPRGLFNYSGAQLATLRSPQVLDAISQSQPQFHLRYVEPESGSTPGDNIGMVIMQESSFCQSDRPITEAEYAQAFARGFTLQQVPVGISAPAFFTHPAINIPGLSLDQLQAIYTGKIANWNQVRGPNLPIVPVTTDPKDSSTMNQIMQNVPGGVSSVKVVRLVRDEAAAIRLVSTTPGAISFGSITAIRGQQSVRPLPIAKVRYSDFVNPYQADGQVNTQALRYATYPLTHNIFVVFRRDGTPDEEAGAAYANLLLSAEGQELVESAGFIPLQ
jgi:phosphate transport system substrate-binding protein